MQSAKNAAASVKETMANIGASAKSGMEKTKATAQEKMDKMAAHDPVEKEMAEEKKYERMQEAELHKQEAKEQNAASRQQTAATGHMGPTTTTGGTATHTATGVITGQPTGTHQMSAVPGQSTNQVTEGVVETHPAGPGRTTGHNPRAGGAGAGYGTGGYYGHGTGGTGGTYP